MGQKINVVRCLSLILVAVIILVSGLYVMENVMRVESPKTAFLKRENRELKAKMRTVNKTLDIYSERLEALEIRDENIYRSIFGLNSIPSSERLEGLRGVARYDALRAEDTTDVVLSRRIQADVLKKRAFVQSSSYDEIELMLHTADNMASSVPTICPVLVAPEAFRISSPFGNRADPIFGRRSFHKGMDFAGPVGNPVFATGDAVVEQVKIERRGYGNQVVLNHGFGYKTRYAHLKTVLVAEGMHVHRGDLIAVSGNSGKSTGPHLHYEVIYKGRPVNPYHYFDRDLPVEQYKQMVKYSEQPEQFFVHPSHKNNMNRKNGRNKRK